MYYYCLYCSSMAIKKLHITTLKSEKPIFRKIFTVKFFKFSKIVFNITNYQTDNFQKNSVRMFQRNFKLCDACASSDLVPSKFLENLDFDQEYL